MSENISKPFTFNAKVSIPLTAVKFRPLLVLSGNVLHRAENKLQGISRRKNDEDLPVP